MMGDTLELKLTLACMRRKLQEGGYEGARQAIRSNGVLG
jgi:hypothetical protein